MSSEIIDAGIADHCDWPAPGTVIQKISQVDLPRKSNGKEGWYYNFHLSLLDGRKASGFITFIRTTSLKPTTNVTRGYVNGNGNPEPLCRVKHELCHSHRVNFAISIPPPDPSVSSGLSSEGTGSASDGQYHFTSAMDQGNVGMMRTTLEVETRMDPLIQRSLLETLGKGKIPLPDILIQGDVSVSAEGSLDIKFGDLASVVCRTNSDGEDVYHIVARAEDGSYGFELDFTPLKAPVNHCGAGGVVQGDLVSPEGGRYYCFVPRCKAAGSIRINNSEVEVDVNNSIGWYDREFGGGMRKWYTKNTSSTESSWKWVSIQLANGWDLTAYTLWDVNIYSGDHTIRDKKAIAVSPEGTQIQCDDHSFEYVESWTSMHTLNEYGTQWRLVIPQLDLDISVEAPFVKQEVRTICSGRGYWKGRVSIAGTMHGAPVNGLGFVELLPTQISLKFEDYMTRNARQTAVEVSKLYPARLIDAEHAMNILALQSPDDIVVQSADPNCLSPLRFTQDLRLDVLHEHLFAPVRHLTDSGGKSWRSFLGITCIEVFRDDSNPDKFRPLLASMELLQTGSLIIDDIEDDSPMRRGVDSVHTVWGIPTAINAGTAAYFAFETGLRSISGLSPEKKVRIYELFFETMRAGHAGQALDIAGQQKSDLDDILNRRVHPSILEKRVLSVHRLKTAIGAANIAKMSAVLADASPPQIVDDVYDIRGSSDVGGVMEKQVPINLNKKTSLKRRGDDIRSGKINIPIAKAGTMMPLDEAQWVWETVLGKPGNDDVSTQKVIDKLEAYGIPDACLKEAQQMVNNSWENVEGHLRNSLAKLHLRMLSWYLVRYNSL